VAIAITPLAKTYHKERMSDAKKLQRIAASGKSSYYLSKQLVTTAKSLVIVDEPATPS